MGTRRRTSLPHILSTHTSVHRIHGLRTWRNWLYARMKEQSRLQRIRIRVTIERVIVLDKISYTPLLLQIFLYIYRKLPDNNRWNTQIITYIRRHKISAHYLISYGCPRVLPTNNCITNLKHWLLLKVLTLIF